MALVYPVHRDQLRIIKKALTASFEKLKAVHSNEAPTQEFIQACEALSVLTDIEESGLSAHDPIKTRR